MKIKILMIYAAVFFIALGVFLVWLFPKQKMGAFVTEKIHGPSGPLAHASFQIHFQDIRPSFPFGLASEHVAIVWDSGLSFSDCSFSVHIPVLSLLKRPYPILMKGFYLDSQVRVDLAGNNFDPVSWNLKHISAKDLTFSDAPLHVGSGDLMVQGTIGGQFVQAPEISVRPGPEFWRFLAGQGEFHGKDFDAKVAHPWFALMDLPPLEFARVHGEFEINNGQILLKEALLKGPVVHLALTGTIRLENPVGNSQVSLEGKVLPESPYLAQLASHPLIRMQVPDIARTGLVFHVTGSLNQLNTSL